jgi:HK97 gp10 family phage protein
MAVNWYGDDVLAKVRAAAFVAVISSTEAVRESAVNKIQNGSKSGRIYTRRSVVHQASAPGESPASDTGTLAQYGRTEYKQDELMGAVIFSTAYASALEYGTRKMEPRPYARPALAEELPEFEKKLAAEVASVLQ